MKILFMGSPDFAVPSLEGLCKSEHSVCSVVTQPDKPKGRNYELYPTPVKVCAEKYSIPVYTPESLRNGEIKDLLESERPDIIVVVAYGKILPDYVLNGAKFGCINAHASLLPRWRGAAPMQRAIMSGDAEYGLTVMKIAKGLDTGDMLLKKSFKLRIDDNLETVHDNMANCAPELLLEVISQLESGKVKCEPQDESKATYAEKITKDDEILDFSDTAINIHNKIRALSPFPLCYTRLNGRIIKVIESKLSDKISGRKFGTVTGLDNGIHVACGDGEIIITKLLPEGKKRMNAADFIRGRGISIGDVFE